MIKYSEIHALKQGHYSGGKVGFNFVRVFIIGCTAPDMGFAFLNIHILHEVVSKVAMVGFSRPERPESVYGET